MTKINVVLRVGKFGPDLLIELVFVVLFHDLLHVSQIREIH